MLPSFVYITCGQNGLHALRRMVNAGCRPIAVVTIPQSVADKYAVAGYVDVAPYCRSVGLDLIMLDSYQISPEALSSVSFDLLVVNGWNRLIKRDVLDIAPKGGIGVHAGHPPIGLGRAPLVWNIIYGHADIEVYVFALTSSADDGNIIASRVVEITPFDNVDMLYQKVMYAAGDLLLDAISRVGAGELGQPQERESAVTYAARTPSDGLIDFSLSERQIYDFVRAQCSPYPGAFSYLDDEKWVIQHAVPFDRFAFRDRARRPGEILAALPSGLVVATGGSPVWLLHAECEGRTVIPAPLSELERLIGRRFRKKSERPGS